MGSHNTSTSIRRLLEELKDVLEREGETSCLAGVVAALTALNSNTKEGFADARSIYMTAAGGKGPLSEYYIQRADPAQQIRENERLDTIRDRLWNLLAR
jgi:regulator of sirC expression with transglutaminase-like and TPR domain